MLEIINANDIAKEMETILGDRYRIFVDNNTGYFRDIPINMNPEEKIGKMNEKIWGIMTTDTGELVALKGLFTASFGFTVMFYVPTDIDISPDLNRLIETLNGSLQEVGNSKYLMTFYTPSAIQGVEIENGEFYQRIVLSGNIAVTNKSIFGNEIKVAWDDHPLDEMVINGQLGLGMEMTPQASDSNSLIPQADYQSATNSLSMVLHLKIEHPIADKLFDYWLNPNLLRNKTENIVISIANKEPRIFECKLLQLDINYSIGGYVIATISMQRFEPIGD